MQTRAGMLLAAGALILALPATGSAQNTRAGPVTATAQMVVAANPHAVAAGIEILEAGGSAVDAAIAVQAVLSMVEPQSSGIGGGAFLIHFDAADEGAAPVLSAYQGRERAPAGAHPSMFLDGDGNERPFPQVAWGGASVGVPGVLRMLELAHADHGRLPWSRLFEPAIDLAERGFEISPRLYFLLDRFENFASARSFRAHYFDDDGKARAVGTVLVNEPYARTLRAIAANGADEMYQGALAEAIVTAVNGNAVSRGQLTPHDLRSYEAEKLAPLCSPYREWTICGPQLPSSGGVTLQQILATVAHFDLLPEDPVTNVHIVAEASRLAFADRALYLGDPEFVDVPVAALLESGYIARRAALIDPNQAIRRVTAGQPLPAAAWDYAPSPLSELASTSHFSIVDSRGDAVSMTTSVQSAFGSQLMVGGFLLNNQLTDFSEPQIDGRPTANRPDARKRPLSSMAPTIVLDQQDRIRLIVGSPGGTRIIGYVVQAIVGVLDLGLDVQSAVAAPHYLARFGAVELEDRRDLEALGEDLEALGHTVEIRSLNSGLHAIAFEYDADGMPTLLGGVDPRREGAAVGR